MADKSNKVPPRKAAAARGKAVARPPVKPRKPTKRGKRPSKRPYVLGVAAVVAVAAIVVGVVLGTSGGSSHGTSAVNYALTSGTKVYGALGPEGIPLEVGPNLAAANTGLTGSTIDGISCGATEQLVYHHHAHIAIFVNGKPYSIPLGVGMTPQVQVTNTAHGQFADGSTNCLYWLHVHAQDGIIHIESPYAQNFVLGDIMDIWHQTLSPTQLGSYHGNVTVNVNGAPWTGIVREVPLTEHAQIVINVGTPIVTPPAINWSGSGL